MQPEEFVLGLLWYLVFVFSTTCHEAAHALAALVGGDKTAYESGQVTLNPLPHIRREPFGTVVVPLLTYFGMGGAMLGWASAPYDPAWRREYPHRAARMALAGPAANGVLFVLGLAGLGLGLAEGWFTAPPGGSFRLDSLAVGAEGAGLDGAAALLSIVLSLNLLLMLFNLLPIPPLDGATAIGLLVPDRRRANALTDKLQNGTLALVGFVAAWLLFFDWIYFPALRQVMHLLYA